MAKEKELKETAPVVESVEKKEKVGIKETIELLDALKVLGVFGADVADDKKVTLSDLQHVVKLGQQTEVVVLGATGLESILAEWTDLDAMEAQQILAKVYEIVVAVIKAYKEK